MPDAQRSAAAAAQRSSRLGNAAGMSTSPHVTTVLFGWAE